jgi:peptidoglycan/LPS O-acetylase OafA/YrhL
MLRDPADSRLTRLDVLRAIAILLVLGRHILVLPLNIPKPLYFFLFYWKRVGWVGVDLFFVLSGFLVSGLLMKDYIKGRPVRPVRFLIRRGFKIYPPFWALLVGSYFVFSVQHIPFTASMFVSEFLFVQNYWKSLWIHTWSLAVEEHFYFGLAVLFGLLFKESKSRGEGRLIPWIVLCVGVFTVMGRSWAGFVLRVPWGSLLAQTHWRLDGLFFGVFISYFYHFRPELMKLFQARGLTMVFGVGGMVFLLPVFFFDIETSRFLTTWGFTFNYLGFGSILWAVLSLPNVPQIKQPRGWKLLSYLGRHSYSIYLWHVPIYFISFWWALSGRGDLRYYYAQIGVYFFGSLLAGVLFSRLVESPCLALREKWFPSRGET